MKDLEKPLTDYCTHWEGIGGQLGLPDSVIENIKADHPLKHRECFRETLKKWLRMDTTATWGKLELAITNTNRATLGLPKILSSKLIHL